MTSAVRTAHAMKPVKPPNPAKSSKTMISRIQIMLPVMELMQVARPSTSGAHAGRVRGVTFVSSAHPYTVGIATTYAR